MGSYGELWGAMGRYGEVYMGSYGRRSHLAEEDLDAHLCARGLTACTQLVPLG